MCRGSSTSVPGSCGGLGPEASPWRAGSWWWRTTRASPDPWSRGFRTRASRSRTRPTATRRWRPSGGGGWDLIVLDWWLPGRDGLEVLGEYRRSGGNTPVLFLTARDAVGDRVRGLDGGADDYLCKPFAFEEMLARARALVRRGRPVEVTTLSYRDVRVEVMEQKAERAGRPLDLTAKELALLVFFLRHPGEVLSRSRIYGHVWGEDYDFISNTLDVHIKELRRALESSGPRLIQTVRGRGYLLGAPPAAAEDGP
ncbi:response regulator transcription factor [Aquisphaera giovannonii]|nr:response regulator transcription factor [Aquisphaera giovannonii]